MGWRPRIGDPDRREAMRESIPDGPEVLGTINSQSFVEQTDPRTTSVWTMEDGTEISLTEPAPPWEQADARFTPSDARRFVECPPQWRLHWINPRLLDSDGWRDWQAVMASDSRVKVRVPSMVTPENYIRRGGSGGDILCWMWQGWYESRREKLRVRTAEQTQAAVDKQSALKEEFERGTYGPYIRLTDAKHPTHTIGDGRSMRD